MSRAAFSSAVKFDAEVSRTHGTHLVPVDLEWLVALYRLHGVGGVRSAFVDRDALCFCLECRYVIVRSLWPGLS